MLYTVMYFKLMTPSIRETETQWTTFAIYNVFLFVEKSRLPENVLEHSFDIFKCLKIVSEHSLSTLKKIIYMHSLSKPVCPRKQGTLGHIDPLSSII